MRPTSCHEVDGLNGAQCNYPLIATGIAHYTHRFHRKKYGKRLAGFVVKVCAVQLFKEDGIGTAKNFSVFLFHLTQNAHAQTWPREGVAINHVIRQTQFESNAAHFVFKQFAQRLYQLQFHGFRQSTHVVVGLDHMSFTGFRGGRFDHVRVDGALGQPVHVFNARGFFIEYINEGVTNNLTLLLRVANAFEVDKEEIFRIGPDDFYTHAIAEHIHYLITFVQAKQTVIDEYAGKLVANRLVQQRRSD